MALPKLTRPEYSTTIPSTGKKIKYHPFSVREEKVLMLAAEGQDPDEIVNAVTNVLERCVTTPQDFKVKDLALFDIEFLFLKTRAKSVGEVITVEVADPEDEEVRVATEINIDRIGVKRDKNHSDLIDLGEIKVKMRYPDISYFTTGVDISNVNSSFDIVSSCISQIIHDDEVYERSDMTDDEISAWVDDLRQEDFNKLMVFFRTIPRLSHTITATNPETGKDFSVTLEGLADFF